MKETQSDIELVNLIKVGEKSAYTKLINRHKSYAYTIAFRIVQQREDAEEIAQDAFLKAFSAIHSFQNQSKFATWFYKIVYNTALMHKRKSVLETTEIDEAKTTISTLQKPNELLENDERKQIIQNLIAKLPSDEATLLNLFYFKELSLEEIAEIVELSISNIKIKLFRARRKLADELVRIYGNEVKNL